MRDSPESFGIAFRILNTDYIASASTANTPFATIAGKSYVDYNIAIYHPKLAISNGTFGLNFTYNFAISADGAT